MLTRQDIQAALKTAGIRPGDHLVAHSSLRRLGPIVGGADGLIDALLDTVGPTGTLAMPTFTYYTSPPTRFDPRRAVSKTGVLTEVFRQRPNVVRSLHPTHSIAAWGHRAEEFVGRHLGTRHLGIGSPLDLMAQAGGWVLLLGVTQTSNSTIHVGEERAGVTKFGLWEGPSPLVEVLCPDGRVIRHELDTSNSCSWAFNAVEYPLRRRNRIIDFRIGASACYLMRGRDVIDATVSIIRERPDILFCTRRECLRCQQGRALATAKPA